MAQDGKCITVLHVGGKNQVSFQSLVNMNVASVTVITFIIVESHSSKLCSLSSSGSRIKADEFVGLSRKTKHNSKPSYIL